MKLVALCVVLALYSMICWGVWIVMTMLFSNRIRNWILLPFAPVIYPFLILKWMLF